MPDKIHTKGYHGGTKNANHGAVKTNIIEEVKPNTPPQVPKQEPPKPAPLRSKPHKEAAHKKLLEEIAAGEKAVLTYEPPQPTIYDFEHKVWVEGNVIATFRNKHERDKFIMIMNKAKGGDLYSPVK